MIDRVLHTPEGVRDIYNAECEKKLHLEQKLHQVFKTYGFRDIQTPTFEFFDVFSKERGTVASKDMYKFFDRDGNTLVLRPDITPSIARCVAKYYKEETYPIRLCYKGNIFIHNNSYQGKLKETTQLGVELMNDNTVDADAHMIALSIDCLLEAGLKDFQIELGHAEFFKGIIEEAGFDEEEEQLRLRIEDKNLFGVEELLESKSLSSDLKQVFSKLPSLFGSKDILELANTLTSNTRALNAIKRLEDIYDILSLYGFEKYVSFDLGMLSKYNYYTGIIFRAYTYGTGDAILGGGRYDHLLEQFGKEAPAIGLAIIVDQLLLALARQKQLPDPDNSNTLILYLEKYRKAAMALARQFRNEGMNIETYLVEDKIVIDEFHAYAMEHHIGGLLILEEEDVIKIVSTDTKEIQTLRLSAVLETEEVSL